MQDDYRASRQAWVRIADETAREIFGHSKATPPLLFVLSMARRDAIQALGALANVPPTETEEIRKLQNEVQRFSDLAHFVTRIFERGDQAQNELEQSEIEDIRAQLRGEGDTELEGADE